MIINNDTIWQPGINSDIFKPFDPKLHIPEVAKMGFKVLEVGCYFSETSFKWQNRHEVNELVKLCEDFSIIIWSAHPPENYPLLLPEKNERQKHKDILKAFAEFCREIGAEYMPVHFWLPKEIFEKVGYFSYFDETLEFLESLYLDYQVMACLETLREPYSAISNQQLIDIVKSCPSALGMVMDTGHAHISGNLHEITRQGKNIIKSLHIHNNNGKDDLHNPPQQGTINWAEFIQDLKDISYQGPIMFEVSGKTSGALQQTIDFYKHSFDIHNP